GLGLLGIGLLAACTALLPILRGNGFNAYSDALLYCFPADWLQEHGFGTPCEVDPLAPVTGWPHRLQEGGFRIGATFLLALVQAVTGAGSSLLVFPAVSAWGLILTVLALFLVARWTVRLPRGVTLFACFVFAVLPPPLYFATHTAFLAQTYGLPALLFGIAVLARATHRRSWLGTTAGLVGLCAAFQLSVYNEFAPFV